MGGKGDRYDNATFQTVIKKNKSELIWRSRFQTRWETENSIGRYADSFYNPRRRQSELRYKSPIAFEADVTETGEYLSTKAKPVK